MTRKRISRRVEKTVHAESDQEKLKKLEEERDMFASRLGAGPLPLNDEG
jgi:hypothetical protein